MVWASLQLIQNNLEKQSLTFAWWDDAIDHVFEKGDWEWTHNNLGGVVAEVHELTSSFVVDLHGKTLVGFIDGEITATCARQYIGKDLPRLIATLFDPRHRDDPAPFFDEPPTVSDFFLIGGVPHIVTVCPFTREAATFTELPQSPRPVLVLTRAVDDRLLALISSITHIRELELVPSATPVEGPFREIQNREGKIIAKLSWQAPVDGKNLLKILIPMMTFALIAVAWFTRKSLQKELILKKGAEEALRKANEGLEQSVRQRTRQLSNMNIALEKEIRLRKSIEKEILVISEREQRNVGQDIHDGLCQQLTGVLCHVGIAEKKLLKRKSIEPSSLHGISDLLKEALENAYNLSRGLCPLSLDPASLPSSLHQLTLKTEKLFGVECIFETSGNPVMDDSAAALQLYRIAQEALNNAAKHASASIIVLRLDRLESRIKVIVRDNGKGFDRDRVEQTSMGLKIMEYRASVLNGKFQMETTEDGGTLVSCSIPLTESPNSLSED